MAVHSLKCFLFIIVVASISCNSNGSKREVVFGEDDYINDGREKHANLEYIEDFYDFGTIKHGEVISYTFTFRNTGNFPLVINDVAASCGCTKPKVSKDILKPNEQATMDVVFDSKGWRGVQYKSVTIHSNGVIPRKSVTIKANVVDK
jgi:hypothetical protein